MRWHRRFDNETCVLQFVPVIVVLDSNLWIEDLALNSGIGSALRFFLKQQGAKLAVPEVVQLEVKRHIRTMLNENINQISNSNRRLLALFGSMKEIILPGNDDVERIVESVFSKLDVEIIEIPFSLESARASFLKTIEKAPPSQTTQEFKDGVLWADCLGLLKDDDVLLATKDKAFYQERTYSRGLAENLLAETKASHHEFQIKQCIADVLSLMRKEVSINEEWFVSEIQNRAHSKIVSFLAKNGFAIDGKPNVKRQLFATENPDAVFFTYAIEFPCQDVTAGARGSGRMQLKGDGTFKPSQQLMIDVRPEQQNLFFETADGKQEKVGNVYLSAHLHLGHKTVTHGIRYRLNDENWAG